VIVVFYGRLEGLGAEVAAVAGAAGDRFAGVFNLADVLAVDLLGHLVHEACGGLFWLGVVGVVEARAAIGADVLGIGGVAGGAVCAEVGFPLVHELVDLLAGHGFGQDLEIGGGGRGGMLMCRWGGGRLCGGGLLGGFHRAGGEENCCSDHGGGCGKSNGCEFQGGEDLAEWAAYLPDEILSDGLENFGAAKRLLFGCKVSLRFLLLGFLRGLRAVSAAGAGDAGMVGEREAERPVDGYLEADAFADVEIDIWLGDGEAVVEDLQRGIWAG
jgi:hypothetical protein